jgi:hypothetical protein
MNPNKSTAPDFFLNLGVVASLYAVVASFLSLVFSIVNKLFPDTLSYYADPYSSGVRLAMATLIIVFPLFAWLSHTVTKALAEDHSRREKAVRRWMVYITLFLSAVMLVIDLVVLLNTFLTGEISVRFSLKVVAVLLVGGLVFWHYLSEARGTFSKKKYQIALYASAVLVLASVVSSFIVFGSPATMRKLRADDTRVQNLQTIQYQILNYWQQKGTLPAQLSDLNDSLSGFSAPLDPQTKLQYGYNRLSKASFKLCATFNLATPSDASQTGDGNSLAYPTDSFGVKGNQWNHEVGGTCFERTIDPDLYPVTKSGGLRAL